VISGKIDGKMFEGNVTDFPAANSNLLLLCQDSEDIPDFKKPVDLIISDPPYADNVNYSELSDFLYVWIRIILKEKYRFFAPLETPKIGEAIESSRKHMDYYKKLTTIFRNCRKQLKPGGLFVFTFHHSDPDTWFKIGEVLNFACFHTVRTYAIPSEAPNVLNIKNKKGISYDLIIVCKEIMDRQKQEIKKREFMKLLKQKYFDRLKSYREERIVIAGIDVIVVFFGEFFELSSKLQPIDKSGKALKFSIITKECKALFETLTKNIR
jgi:adenine-specific DNA methylase